MSKVYRVSTSIAWQQYECIDMLFILNRKNGYFYFFQDSARIIICNILSFKPLHEIYDICCELYDASEKEIVDEVNKFVDLLLLEGIIYE